MSLEEKIGMLCRKDRYLTTIYTETGAVNLKLFSPRGMLICEATADPFACAVDVLFSAVMEKALAALEQQEGPW